MIGARLPATPPKLEPFHRIRQEPRRPIPPRIRCEPPISGGRQRRALEIIAAAKRDKTCLDCGTAYPPHVLDFDHVRGVKHRDVSYLTWHGGSPQNLILEIAKCDLVCSNCHRERTFQRKKLLFKLKKK